MSVISFSNDATIARPGLYVLGFRPEEQIQRIVRYAGAQGRARMAALAPEDAYGERALAAFRSTVATVPGATAVITQTYPAQSDSPRDAVEYVAAFGRPGRPAGPGHQPGRLGFTPTGPAAAGLRCAADRRRWSAGPVDRGPARILRRDVQHHTAFGHDALAGRRRPAGRSQPERVLASDLAARRDRRVHAPLRRCLWPQPAPLAVLAYDATALAVLLSTTQPRFTAAQLTAPQGFAGGAGIFRLRADGLAEHGLAVIQVDAGSGRVIDPAPASFNDGLAQR